MVQLRTLTLVTVVLATHALGKFDASARSAQLRPNLVSSLTAAKRRPTTTTTTTTPPPPTEPSTGRSAPPGHVASVVGGSAIMPCNISTDALQGGDDFVTLILWYKDDTGGAPIYTGNLSCSAHKAG